MYWISFILVSVVAYLMGSLNFSIIITRILNNDKDIRSIGSGNAGFTNMLRSLGVAPAVVTFIGDFIKGIAAICFSMLILTLFSVSNMNLYMYGLYSAQLCCLLGHIFPCFFGFKGGKGVLTAGAVILMIDYRVFLISIAVFIIVLLVSKIMSLSSIIGIMAYPFVTFFIHFFECGMRTSNMGYFLVETVVAFVMSGIIIYKHKKNIINIIHGTEKKMSIAKK